MSHVARPIRLALFYGVLTLAAVAFILPYVLTAFASLKPINEIFSEPAWQLPSSLYLHNYSNALNNYGFLKALENTVLVTCALTVGQVTFGVLAAYAFARMRFPGRDGLFWAYLLTLMIPNAVTLIPLFTIMRYAHLLNTYWAIFLPYALGVPYSIFLMRQFFLGIPQHLLDAAKIDGCSELGILRRVMLPLSRPVIVTATLIAFVFGWNNFLWPLIVTNSTNKYVLTIAIAEVAGGYGTRWDVVLTGGMIALIPLLILFAVFQRQIIRSVQLTGSVK
jgi:multiple sugar transport system permease protein